MPYINSVSEQMLIDGPDGLESRLLQMPWKIARNVLAT